VVRTAEKLAEAPAETAGYGTEAPHFAALGSEVVLLGPGHIAQAHQPDEHVSRAELGRAVEMYERLVATLAC